MNKDLPSVSEVYRMLLQEESHKEVSKSIVTLETMAFNVDRRKSYDRLSHKNQIKKPNFYCQHFKMVGHTIERCFKIHGYPNNNKGPTTKKYAAMAHNEDNLNGKDFGLSSDQFTKLLSFLGKQDS